MGTCHFDTGRGRPLCDETALLIDWGANQTAIYTCAQDEYDVVDIVDGLAELGVTVTDVDYRIFCSQIRDCACP